MSVMKVRYKKLGGHYHCTIFTARLANTTYANCGDVVFDELEWEDIRGIMSGAHFVEDDGNRPFKPKSGITGLI